MKLLLKFLFVLGCLLGLNLFHSSCKSQIYIPSWNRGLSLFRMNCMGCHNVGQRISLSETPMDSVLHFLGEKKFIERTFDKKLYVEKIKHPKTFRKIGKREVLDIIEYLKDYNRPIN